MRLPRGLPAAAEHGRGHGVGPRHPGVRGDPGQLSFSICREPMRLALRVRRGDRAEVSAQGLPPAPKPRSSLGSRGAPKTSLPHTHLANCSYNTMLTLSHLSDVSDGVALVENEALFATCKKSLGINSPSFDDMNEARTTATPIHLPLARTSVPPAAASRDMPTPSPTQRLQVAAKGLASVLLPARSVPVWDASVPSRPLRLLRDVVLSTCTYPGCKLLSLR